MCLDRLIKDKTPQNKGTGYKVYLLPHEGNKYYGSDLITPFCYHEHNLGEWIEDKQGNEIPLFDHNHEYPKISTYKTGFHFYENLDDALQAMCELNYDNVEEGQPVVVETEYEDVRAYGFDGSGLSVNYDYPVIVAGKIRPVKEIQRLNFIEEEDVDAEN